MSWQTDDAEAAVALDMVPSIRSQTRQPSIDHLAALLNLQQEEDSDDGEELIDGVLAEWPEARWWRLL